MRPPGQDQPGPEALLDALLDGRPLPGGDPEGLQPVADVLAALRAPAAPAELAGQASALAAFRAQPQSSARAARSPRSAARAGQQSRARRHGPLLRPRLAMAFAAGVVGLAGLAAGAYTGHLPGPVEQLAHTLGVTASPSAARHRHHHQPAKPTSSPAATPSPPRRPAAARRSPVPPGPQRSHLTTRTRRPDGWHAGQRGSPGPGSPGDQGNSPSPSPSGTPEPGRSPAAQPSAQPSTSPHQHSSPSSPP